MPPTSGVITTPDILIVKLVPDVSSIGMVGTISQYALAVFIVFYILQQVVGVSIARY